MKKQTQKALTALRKARKNIEHSILTGKIDLTKPSCFYSKKEMNKIEKLFAQEKACKQAYYALLSKDTGLGKEELTGSETRAPIVRCGNCHCTKRRH